MKSRIKVDNIFEADDSRKVLISVKKMRDGFEKEFNLRADALFETVKRDVVAQLMATCLVELSNEFGFGKDRLNRFKSGVEALFIAMQEGGIFGQDFNTQNCIDLMRDKYGIDVECKNQR